MRILAKESLDFTIRLVNILQNAGTEAVQED